MRSIVIVSFAVLAAVVSAVPTIKRSDYSDYSPDGKYFPLPDGFPNPNEQQLNQIEKDAHGIIPNGPPPPSISPEGITNLKLIAFNELFEVAFFHELLYNLTNKAPGYDLGYGHEYVLNALTAIIAQEKEHALSANNALLNFNQQPIEPCKYQFPVQTFQEAITLAATFTDLVLGTLQDVSEIFAQHGDSGLVRLITSVIGNEGEQEGFFRLTEQKIPSAQPFLTTATRAFAFTAVQSFTVPGSCPNLYTIPLATFAALNVLTPNISADTAALQFSVNKSAIAGDFDHNNMGLVYINQQNKPVIEKLQNTNVNGDTFTFEAAFPVKENLMYGLTVAALTRENGDFESADDVAFKTIAGPGLIEVDDKWKR